MTGLESTLAAVILGFGIVGFSAGLIQGIGSIVGLVVGVVLASRSYQSVGGFLLPLVGGNQIAAAILGFALVLFFTSKAIGLVFYFIDRAFKLVAILPGTVFLNRLGGLTLGLIEGVFVVGVTLNLVVRLPLSEKTLTSIQDSALLTFSMNAARWMISLFPEALEKAQGVLG